MAQSFHLYSEFPYDLRLAIIEEFLEDRWYHQGPQADKLPDSFKDGGSGWPKGSGYATLNREWQTAVERRKFRFLAIHFDTFAGIDDTAELRQICVGDRVNMVSEICLSVNLDPPSSTMPWRVQNERCEPPAVPNNRASKAIRYAEQMTTEAFSRLFEVLSGWSDKRKPLVLTYALRSDMWSRWEAELYEARLRQLRIPCSSLPAVGCVGSIAKWKPDLESYPEVRDIYMNCDIHAADMFDLLARLPNAEQAAVRLGDDTELEAAEGTIQGESLKRASRLRKLSLQSGSRWMEGVHPSRRTPVVPSGAMTRAETHIWMSMPPVGDRSLVQDGQLFVSDPAPDDGTVAAWRAIARRQWRCNLLRAAGPPGRGVQVADVERDLASRARLQGEKRLPSTLCAEFQGMIRDYPGLEFWTMLSDVEVLCYRHVWEDGVGECRTSRRHAGWN